MNAKDVLKSNAAMSRMVLKTYIADLNDADLLTRPGPGCNHLAWQLGHLINSEVSLLQSICPDVKPVELPAGFAEAHAKENIASDDPKQFCTRQQYLDLLDRATENSLAALDQMSDADLEAPAPEKFRQHFPKVSGIMMLIASHPMMHAGQFAVARRKLGKPVVI